MTDQEHQDDIIEEKGDFQHQVREEIGSLREKIDSIWEVMQAEYGFNAQRVMGQMRRFSLDMKEPIRWGFIGAWRRHGGQSQLTACSIYTSEMDTFFGDENADPKHVARFAGMFINPKTVEVCLSAFREKQTRDELKTECTLDDEELDEAIQPLLDGELVEWKELDGTQKLCAVGQGFSFLLTMIGLTKTWYNQLYEENKRPIKC